MSVDRQLPHGAYTQVSHEFGTSKQMIASLWKRGLQSVNVGALAMIVSSKKKQSGRKKLDYTGE